METIFDKIREARLKAPVDVDALSEELGIEVNYEDFGDEISGELVRKNGSFEINVNMRHARSRQRFTIAHELGHFLYHRNLIGEGVNDNKAYRTSSHAEYYNSSIKPYHETEANKFAASLLMPENLVIKMWNENNGIDKMAENFQVSKDAMTIRLNSLGFHVD